MTTVNSNLAPAEPVYHGDVSEVYDFFYRGRGKHFAAEAATVANIVRSRKPDASSLLDVACGTGEHLRAFAGEFAEVAGLEMSSPMCDLARSKGIAVHQGDMRSFGLGRHFAAVSCLTSSIGYMSTVDELRAAVRAMAGHLVAGGVLVIDPYWFPEVFLDGHIARDMVRDTVRTVARLSHSARTDDIVRHDAHYLVADPDGIRHFTHVQQMRLFTKAQYLGAIDQAGCAPEYVHAPGGFADRGLFVGVRRG
jgi:SAM-dependent methyltransferase